jgi:hypothetical protein
LQKARVSVAYFAMRLGISCVVGLLLSAGVASSQTPKSRSLSPSPSAQPTLPESRPALIGTAPNSLINTIGAADLMKKGQKEAAVMFSCLVAPTGDVVRSGAYSGTRGSELLEQELLKRLATAKLIPAVHNHQPVIAVFYGTVKFAVVDGKPRLRIFANQQLSELEPPLLGFGDAALSDFDGAKFIPAFRNGKPVECSVKIPVYYKPSA